MNPRYMIILLLFPVMVQAQAPFFYRSFDEPVNLNEAVASITRSTYRQAPFVTSYSSGLKGKAMDLTEDAPLRIPEVLDQKLHPSFGEQSFSVQLWVQTKKNAPQGTAVMSSRKHGDSKLNGWTLGTGESGAWYWQVSDGTNVYTYEPTARRQAVNDGRWHQLTVSVDRQRKEMRMYLDGRNVAIYNIEELGNIDSEAHTVIGGTDDYTDWGSRGEWTSFNGKVDEVKIWDRVVGSHEVRQDYCDQMSVAVGEEPVASHQLKVQVWNIWHGGHRYGQHVGVQRTVDVLKKENADIIGLIETYGSGAVIADSLGYYFYLISSNLSIMSRYPIEECIRIFKPFFSGGAIINLGNDRKLAFFDIWLNYLPDMCDLRNGKRAVKKMLEDEQKTRLSEINSILGAISSYTGNADQVPVIVMGDFNSGSHLDWTSEYKDMHHGITLEWPVSRTMQEAGFLDSFRKVNPNAFWDPGYTWSPLINPNNIDCVYDRIDFIYYKGRKITPFRSETLTHHPVFWPSDHASVVSWFYLSE